MNYDVVVVGGGPAGMLAAIAARENNKRVCILDKNSSLGKKLLITGGGRCNVTSSLEIGEFYDHIIRNPKFLFSAFSAFDNLQLIDFFKEIGVDLKIEGKKFYPVDDTAVAVLEGLVNTLKKMKVDILYDFDVEDFVETEESKWKITSSNKSVIGNCIIFATGGASYKGTGSDGYMFKILQDKGIDIKPLLPTLVRLNSNQEEITGSQGISISEAKVTVFRKKKKLKEVYGGVVFAHNGLGGPLALNASGYITDKKFEEIQLFLDLVPTIGKEEIVKMIKSKDNKSIVNKVSQLLPKDLVKNFLGSYSNIDVNNMKNVELEEIINKIKNFEIKLTGTGGINESVVTRGGVSVKEVDPKTMMLKKLPNIFVCGEMLDVDAETGGFNLQIAFSTGFLAGKNATSKRG